jgi:nucleoid-associated protein YgaU
MSSRGGSQAPSEALWAEDDDFDEAGDDAPIVAQVPRRGRGLSGSYADRVASDADPGTAAAAAGVGAAGVTSGGVPDEGDDVDDFEPRRAEAPPPTYRAESRQEPANPDDEIPRRVRHRERDAAGAAAAAGGAAAGAGIANAGGPGPGRERQNRGPAPEWERAKPMEAYPTLRSRRLPELALPPILVAVVAIALAAAVLFALPGLLGFGKPSAGGSQSPSTPTVTALPSLPPTPVPQATPVVYVVQSGDTLSRIAGRFGITLADLIAANTETLPNPDKLQIGDRLVIPVPQPSELPAASEIPAAT